MEEPHPCDGHFDGVIASFRARAHDWRNESEGTDGRVFLSGVEDTDNGGEGDCGGDRDNDERHWCGGELGLLGGLVKKR